jgi:hypothetical protein
LPKWKRDRDAKRKSPLENEDGKAMVWYRSKDDGRSTALKEACALEPVIGVVGVVVSVAEAARAVVVAQAEVADGWQGGEFG